MDSPVQHGAAVYLREQAGEFGGVAGDQLARGDGVLEKLARFFPDGSELREGANRLRKSRAKMTLPFDYSRRPETIEETAEMVTARGGIGIAVVVDHTEVKGIEKLIARIRREQGKLHIVVNAISEIIPPDLGKTFWQLNLENGFLNLRNAVHTHIITNHFAAPLLIESAKKSEKGELIVEIGDGDSYTYRGHLFYDPGEYHGDSHGICDGA
jgi:NAD(P)-dependent dehydrogenase (short-subunit alcohol dehydrogenase family)